ncbi:MAG: outer membrane beta-barrel protein [Alphaproteobacteria bacterium]|nr:outer membrane beta-barrel protein [Alphaproteobacteria bacterium]
MTRHSQLPAYILAGLLCQAAAGSALGQQAGSISDLPPGQANNTDRYDSTSSLDSNGTLPGLRGSRSVLDDPADEFVPRNREPQDAQLVQQRRRRADRNALRGIPDAEIPGVGGIPRAIPEEPFDLGTLDPQTTGSIEPDPDPVENPTDPYAPLGLRNGSFTYFPSLEISSLFTDNVGQDATGERSAFGVVLRPSLNAQSNWARHNASLTVASEHTIFPGDTDENRNELSVNSEARIDVLRSFVIDYAGRYILSQDSSDGDNSGATTGTSIDHEIGADVTFRRQNARFLPSLRFGVERFMFGDEDLVGGGTQNNSDQDYVEPSVELRVGYAISQAVQPYIAAGYSRRVHDDRLDRSGLERDSDGYEIRAGADLNFGPVLSGNVDLGYGVRDFEDSTLSTADGFVGTSSLTWSPTPLTTFTFGATGSLDETTTAGASAIQNINVNANVSHRLRRNLTATGGASISFADYLGIRRLDETYQVDLGLAYAIGRHIELVANYQFNAVESTIPSQEYTENQITAGVRFRL